MTGVQTCALPICSVTSSVLSVSVNALPTPVMSGALSACSGTQQTYAASVANGGAPSYTWSIVPGTALTGQGTSAIVVTTGTTNLVIKVVTQYASSGCKDSVSKNVTVNQTPTPQIAGNTAPCVGTSQTYSVTNVNGSSSYAWTKSGVGTFVTGSSGTSVSMTFASAGQTQLSTTETTSAN